MLDPLFTRIGPDLVEDEIKQEDAWAPLVFYNGFLLLERDYEIKQEDIGGCYALSWVLALKEKAPNKTFSITIIDNQCGIRYDYFVKDADWKFE